MCLNNRRNLFYYKEITKYFKDYMLKRFKMEK